MLWLVKGEGIGIIGGWVEIENRFWAKPGSDSHRYVRKI